MSGWRLLLVTLAGLGWLAASPVVAGGIRGTVRCADRCEDFVVYVEGVGGSYDGAGQVAEFGQKDKLFIPHVLPLLAGSTLRIGNDDPFMHNVHARKNDKTVFNVNLLFQYQTMDMVIDGAGVYEISCEPHPEMAAVIVALDSPFFTQPDEAGRFEIQDVPTGSYEIVSFDAERDRRKTKLIEVGAGLAALDF